jgi:Zn-dependent protease with chaperone function
VIAALALLGYAALLLTAGAAALARARWADRAPRLAVAAWLALTGSAVVSVVLGGAALVVPTVRVSTDLAALLASCAMALRAGYAHPGGAAMAGAGAVLGLSVTGRVTWCAAGTLARAALARRRHRGVLAVAGRHDRRLGAVVVDHDEAAAWCLPGAGRQVVLTTAAVRALDDVQIAAVLAHERAHQRGRHHLLVGLAGSMAAAFPRVRAFRQGHEQVARLAELLADDAAAAASPRLKVAEALLALAAPAPADAAALGAGGSATGARVRRLIAAPAPIGRARTVAGMLTVAALAAFPLVLLAGPAAASGMTSCPHPAAAAPAAMRAAHCGAAGCSR